MIDLLIESLMVEGSLETAFETAVQDQIAQDINDHPEGDSDVSNNTPLLQLSKQLLRCSTDACLSRFHMNKERSDKLGDENKARCRRSLVIDLLLKLQRLLIGSSFSVFLNYQRSGSLEKGTNTVLCDNISVVIHIRIHIHL